MVYEFQLTQSFNEIILNVLLEYLIVLLKYFDFRSFNSILAPKLFNLLSVLLKPFPLPQ